MFSQEEGELEQVLFLHKEGQIMREIALLDGRGNEVSALLQVHAYIHAYVLNTPRDQNTYIYTRSTHTERINQTPLHREISHAIYIYKSIRTKIQTKNIDPHKRNVHVSNTRTQYTSTNNQHTERNHMNTHTNPISQSVWRSPLSAIAARPAISTILRNDRQQIDQEKLRHTNSQIMET